MLKFDSSLCAGTSLSGMTLKLAITNGNQSANGIFNYLGGPGDFDLCWISNDWKQGYGTPKILAGLNVGITYTGLVDLMERSPSFCLETLHYDANYPYWEGEHWFTFELDLENDRYDPLVEAVERGETITLMLMATPESHVCFNIRAYVQCNKDGTQAVRETGPVLEVNTTLPFSDIDFDNNGTIDYVDIRCILDHWHETGEDLIGDIAPLGGDGVIDILDLTEFMKYWPTFQAPMPGTD